MNDDWPPGSLLFSQSHRVGSCGVFVLQGQQNSLSLVGGHAQMLSRSFSSSYDSWGDSWHDSSLFSLTF